MNEWMDPNQATVHELRKSLKGLWPHPTPLDAWAFLVTEVGELGALLLRAGFGQAGEEYLRHHEKTATHADFREEFGDVMLMLCTVANHLEVNLTDALRECVEKLEGRYEDNQS
jgi:NTP pyrophosphatase (non-canonical NTP hydrolase)